MAFQVLKRCFTSAPILTLPDPRWQFDVKVDASSEGIGVVLSQRSEEDGKMHHVTTFSKSMVSLRTLSQPRGPSLCLDSGRNSADSLEPRPA